MEVWDYEGPPWLRPAREPSHFYSNCFLKDRYFKVRVGSSFSDSHPQEMGVPQGSILSVTLFSVKINSITKCLKPIVDCSLYVDDFQIYYRSSNTSIIERQLQLCLNKLQQCATDNGFRFSKTKTLWRKVRFRLWRRPNVWGLSLT